MEDMEKRRDGVQAVAEEFFGTVVVNRPAVGNFAAAVDWCWTTADTDYLFHLEDDWILTQQVDIKDVLKRIAGMRQVVLRAYPRKYSKMALSPSLIAKDTYKMYAGSLNYKHNPEVQLRGKNAPNSKQIVTYGRTGIVKDIGRPWSKHQPVWHNARRKSSFVSWTSTPLPPKGTPLTPEQLRQKAENKKKAREAKAARKRAAKKPKPKKAAQRSVPGRRAR
jgi:hypothetical protein